MDAKYLGEGFFWPIYEGLKGKDAEDFLIKKQNGEVKWAYGFENMPVDLVRGNFNKGRGVGIGLAKIVNKHPEVLGRIQELLDTLPQIIRDPDQVILGNMQSRLVIRLQRNGEKKAWLMTAYDLD